MTDRQPGHDPSVTDGAYLRAVGTQQTIGTAVRRAVSAALDRAVGTQGAVDNCRDELERRRREDAAVAALARRVPPRPSEHDAATA